MLYKVLLVMKGNVCYAVKFVFDQEYSLLNAF